MYEEFLKSVEARLSERPTRQEFADVSKLFTKRTIANKECLGEFPKGILYGKRVLYERAALIAWLRQYLERNARKAGRLNKAEGGNV